MASARWLVGVHGVAALVLMSAATHHAWIAAGYARGRTEVRRVRRAAATLAAAYGVTAGLGLLAYPAFRYHVRALVLDRYAPWAANLFDTKENFAMLGLPLVAIALGVSRVLASAPASAEERALGWAYAACAGLATGIVWFAAISGLVVTHVKGL